MRVAKPYAPGLCKLVAMRPIAERIDRSTWWPLVLSLARLHIGVGVCGSSHFMLPQWSNLRGHWNLNPVIGGPVLFNLICRLPMSGCSGSHFQTGLFPVFPQHWLLLTPLLCFTTRTACMLFRCYLRASYWTCTICTGSERMKLRKRWHSSVTCTISSWHLVAGSDFKAMPLTTKFC